MTNPDLIDKSSMDAFREYVAMTYPEMPLEMILKDDSHFDRIYNSAGFSHFLLYLSIKPLYDEIWLSLTPTTRYIIKVITALEDKIEEWNKRD